MDPAEATVARKRLERWPERDQEWARSLPAAERSVVAELLALLDVQPVEETT